MFYRVWITIVQKLYFRGVKMKKNTRNLMILVCTIIMLMTGGCSSKNLTSSTSVAEAPKSEKTPVTLTISAAASLKGAMEEIKKQYTEENSNVTINFNFGSSGALQQQIEQGAPADLFMSAATKQMNALSEKGLLLEDTKVNLLGNTVVLVVKSDSSLAIDFKDSASDKIKKIALGEPKTVPSGQYAEEIYKTLNILDEVKTKAIYGKDVTEVLTWVESGNVDAGVVYGTDAKASIKVKVTAVATKDLYKTPVVYPVAVIKASMNVNDSKEFLNFLSRAKAKAVFEQYGFDFLIK